MRFQILHAFAEKQFARKIFGALRFTKLLQKQIPRQRTVRRGMQLYVNNLFAYNQAFIKCISINDYLNVVGACRKPACLFESNSISTCSNRSCF